MSEIDLDNIPEEFFEEATRILAIMTDLLGDRMPEYKIRISRAFDAPMLWCVDMQLSGDSKPMRDADMRLFAQSFRKKATGYVPNYRVGCVVIREYNADWVSGKATDALMVGLQ